MTLYRRTLLVLPLLMALACSQELVGTAPTCDPQQEECEDEVPDGKSDGDGGHSGESSGGGKSEGSGGRSAGGLGGATDDEKNTGGSDHDSDGSTGGTPGSGGKGSGSGGKGSGSGGGASGSGGKGSGSASGGSASGSGGGGNSGGGDMGSGGTGEVSPTVTGRVVDFFLAPIASAPVTIEGLGTVLTDDEGEFVFDDVPLTYDVEFVLQPEGRAYVYRFESLTRRNPTLQVYSPGYREYGSVLVTYENLPAGPETASQAYASPVTGSIMRPSGWQYGVDWIGSKEVSTTLHALQWEEGNEGEDPTYTSYAATGVTMDGMGVEEITLGGWRAVDDTARAIASVSQTGAELSMFLRFDDGASIELWSDVLVGASQEYLVPAIPGSAITISASNTTAQGELLLAHVTVDAGQNVPEIELPPAVTLLGPATNVTVDEDTRFTWNAPSDSPCVMLYIESVSYYSGARVVTCDAEATLSESFALYAAEDHVWHVQTHGSYSSIDAMTTSRGYLDSFSYELDAPSGKNQGPGTYTQSQQRVFTTPP